MIVSEGDTLAVFSHVQYKTVGFSIDYIRHLQELDTISTSELNNLDVQIRQLDNIIAVERLKSLEKDSINVNLTEVIQDYKKAIRKEKTKKTLSYILMGIIAGGEAGVIAYLLIR